MKLAMTSIRGRRARLILATALSWFGLSAGCEPGNTYAPPPPPEVTAGTPVRRAVTTYAEYTGTTQAVESVELRARVEGFLERIGFKPGDDVKKGDLLFVIDPRPFQARVDRASADFANKKAVLEGAESDFKRNASLYQRKVISDQEYIKSKSDRDAARAAADAAEATLAQAKLDLGYTKVTAPIGGRISRNLVDVGNLVGNGTATLLATIVSEDPIYAYMTVSEADLLRFRAMVRKGERIDYRKYPLPLQLGLANEEGFPHEGRLDYADPGVNPSTGTILARGVFPNHDRSIVSGLFVRIRVPSEQHKEAILVPERAIGADQAGSYLLVVGKDHVVERRGVRVGAAVGGLRVIEENLGPDDLVVIDGLQRARPGSRVNPKRAETPSLAPGAAPAAAKTKRQGGDRQPVPH